MKILPLLNTQYNNFSNRIRFTGNQPKPIAPVCDIFVPNDEEYKKAEYYFRKLDYDRLSDSQPHCKICLPVFTNVQNLDDEVYKALPKKEKEFLRYWTNKKIAVIEAVKVAIKLAKALKETKDSEYGKEGYSVLGVGRSPSPVTEIMNREGSKSQSVPFSYSFVKNIPVDSNYRKAIMEYFDWKKYLASFGFDEKTFTDKSKTTFLTDYSCTGRTLEFFKGLIDDLYPNNNVKTEDIMSMVRKIDSKILGKYSIGSNKLRLFDFSLEDCDYKFSFCTCPHYDTVEDYTTHKKPTLSFQTKLSLFDYYDEKRKK